MTVRMAVVGANVDGDRLGKAGHGLKGTVLVCGPCWRDLKTRGVLVSAYAIEPNQRPCSVCEQMKQLKGGSK